MSIQLLTFILLAQLKGLNSETSIECKDEAGNFVDWFVMYKFPIVLNRVNGYAYATITNINQTWTYNKRNKIKNKERNPFAETLRPIFDGDENVDFVLYNDYLPGKYKTNFKLAHAKGIVAFDDHQGFWLIHSVPAFPDKPTKGYKYPKTGDKNGQIALCISFENEKNLELIDQALFKIRANVYESKLDNEIRGKDGRNLFQLLAEQKWFAEEAESQEILKIKSRKGIKFSVFLKGKDSPQDDIYSRMAVKDLASSLVVQSWLQHPHTRPLKSKCDHKYKTENVNTISFHVEKKPLEWSHQVDHSKWAISKNVEDALWCIGDLNRMEAQKKRTGLVTCFQSKKVWNLFHGIIESIEECSV